MQKPQHNQPKSPANSTADSTKTKKETVSPKTESTDKSKPIGQTKKVVSDDQAKAAAKPKADKAPSPEPTQPTPTKAQATDTQEFPAVELAEPAKATGETHQSQTATPASKEQATIDQTTDKTSPVKDAQAPAQATTKASDQPAQIPVQDKGKETVFVYVEDDMMSREIMKILLTETLGYPNLTTYEDSTDIIERLEKLPRKPDIILLDIHMKPLTGFEVLERLRQHTDFRHTFVVALTASVMNEEIKHLRNVGFDGVIAKPINQKIFPQQLEQVMQGEKIWQL